MKSEFYLFGEPYTRLAAETRARQILHGSELGVELGVHEMEFMMALLLRHPKAAEKIGAGVLAIRTTSSKYGNRCFELLRADGSSCEFSYRACLVTKKKSLDHDLF